MPPAIINRTAAFCADNTDSSTCETIEDHSLGAITVGGASASVGIAPESVSGQVSASGTTADGGGGAWIIWYFEIVGPPGPAGSVHDPVDVALRDGITSETDDSGVNADAGFLIDNANPGDSGPVPENLGQFTLGKQINCFDFGVGNSECEPQFIGTLDFFLTPNYVYEAMLEAGVGTGGGPSSAFAFADPHMYLDADAIAAGYRLIFSDGIGNTIPSGGGSVPEPGSLGLLSVALIGFGAVRRRAGMTIAR
ncbi:MAG TPA: PEP-CTERM sorting domain-containing protein [Casimicrobiaceae bacterium]|nr:PEP-CTERM sorting domain-containing protein [Casimicrobiaceae bacterium]